MGTGRVVALRDRDSDSPHGPVPWVVDTGVRQFLRSSKLLFHFSIFFSYFYDITILDAIFAVYAHVYCCYI